MFIYIYVAFTQHKRLSVSVFFHNYLIKIILIIILFYLYIHSLILFRQLCNCVSIKFVFLKINKCSVCQCRYNYGHKNLTLN